MGPFKPTPGEYLILQRRRQRWSLVDASRYYRVSLAQVALWELDRCDGAPATGYGLAALADVCFLARMRAGLTQEEVAADLLHETTAAVEQMERGEIPCIALAEYLIARRAM